MNLMMRNKILKSNQSSRDVSDDNQTRVDIRINPSSFFKIILPAVLDQCKLRIPQEFANKFWHELSRSCVTLTVPTGVSWTVVVSKCQKNRLYLHEGWSKFMDQNQIKYGYFLQFNYLGDRRFDVIIIDCRCIEIEYPCAAHCPTQHPHPAHPHRDSDASFHIVVKISHLHAANYLHIPKRFADKYMKHSWKESVKLEADDGREWDVECYKSAPGIRLVGAGWKKFAQDNDWQLGDEYSFRMVSDKDSSLVLKVSKTI